MHFHIDIVGTCNLRCPSCPVGNTGASPTDVSKRMSPELLSQILDKADREFGSYSVGFFNWTEPLLHPQLRELCQIVGERGKYLCLSSNLNISRNYEDFLPWVNEFCISLSGFTQEVYQINHQGGSIEKVKKNMIRLASAKQKYAPRMRTYVRYIRHKHNLAEEEKMREFATSLGIEHAPAWGYFMPYEKVLSLLRGDRLALSDSDRSIVESLALHPSELINIGKSYSDNRCHLRESQIVLDPDGNSILCCSVYDQTVNSIGNYLDMDIAAMQSARFSHSTCATCMEHHIHTMVKEDKHLCMEINKASWRGFMQSSR